MDKSTEIALEPLIKYLETLKSSKSVEDNKMYEGICSWIKSYVGYMEYDKKFNPKKMKKYERGEILYVNLGYNVGSEERQPHYVVVVENNNSISSPVVTVVPLTSTKDKSEEEINKNSVMLGTELYDKLKSKHDQLQKECKERLEELIQRSSQNRKLIDATNKRLDEVMLKSEEEELKFKEEESKLKEEKLKFKEGLKLKKEELDRIKEELDRIKENLMKLGTTYKETEVELESINQENEKIENLIAILKKKIASNENVKNRINKMKDGSIALVNQVTTISKLKIYDPKKRVDSLYGIKLEPDTLDKINSKMKEIFIH